MSHILLLEPSTSARARLRDLLHHHQHSVAEAASVAAAADMDPADYALIIANLRVTAALGTDIIPLAGATPVVIIAENANIRAATDAMRLGAADFIGLPCDPEELMLCIARVLRDQQLRRQNDALRKELERQRISSGMIGSSAAMQRLFSQMGKVAPTQSTVLIRGESGTGKELVARALHDGSNRRNAPMISVNCAAIPANLIESELFGHVRGAFTGATGTRQGLVEAADGGTLFLDEIGELSADAQARLLRVLQEGEIRRVGSVETRRVDVRVLAATHRDLHGLIRTGHFREDLYFRLNVLNLELPPLRERGNDILELANIILARTCQRLARPPMALTDAALDLLSQYHWPGNVRELENAMERAAILCDGAAIGPELLAIEPLPAGTAAAAASRTPAAAAGTAANPTTANNTGALSLEEYFLKFVREHEDGMTETELAQHLGISRKSLWERRQRMGIPRKRAKPR